MAHVGSMSNIPKKLSSWQIFTNDGRFNNVLPPSRRHPQRPITSNPVRTGHPKYRIRSYQTTKDHPLPRTETNNKISSSTSSINEIKSDQGHQIRVDFRAASNPHLDKYDRRASLSFSRVKSISDQETQSKRSSRLSKNLSESTRECAICLIDQPLTLFEEHYSNECKHSPRTICDPCIYNYIKSVLENATNPSIICPEPYCQSRFRLDNIRSILKLGNNLELFERYDRQLTHEHLERMNEFVWCAHNGCGSGQFHDMGSYSNRMVTCIKCKKQTCAYHRTIWHVGMTCEQYDRSKILSGNDNTQIWLKKYSKNCPKCQTPIERISGCDHMTCKQCKHQFCWQCFANYRKIQVYGLQYHMKHCSHYPFNYHSYQNPSTSRSTTCEIL